MVGVPVNAVDMRSNTLYTEKNSSVFGFQGGYIIKDTLQVGKGYWVRYPDTATVNICGTSPGITTIPVLSGWNMIGAYDRKIIVDQITTTPNNIITSQFFGFNNGYIIADTLKIGKGYWIRVNQNGVLNVGSALAKGKTNMLAQGKIDPKWGQITVTDKTGKMSVLYVSQGGEELSRYDLPPLPPGGISDVRWTTDRLVEVLSEGGKDILLSGMSYPVEVRISGLNLQLKDNSGEIEKVLRDGEKLTISNPVVDKLSASIVEIPKSYELYQNYPNPFNPETVIGYQLPVNGKVQLKIYDVLGREVETLVNEIKEAGKYTAKWNASKYTSGVYVYRISAGSYSAVKKLMLMK
jgi:hypothetical protein